MLLPTEDLENAGLRVLVGDIVADLILGQGVGGKACEGWLIWDGIANIVGLIRSRAEPKATGREMEEDTRSRLEKFGLLAAKENARNDRSHDRRHGSNISAIFWVVLQYGYLAFTAMRFIIQGLVRASSLPARSPPSSSKSVRLSPISKSIEAPEFTPKPVLTFRIFACLSNLLSLRERMPWLTGGLSLAQYHVIGGPGRLGDTDGLLDK